MNDALARGRGRGTDRRSWLASSQLLDERFKYIAILPTVIALLVLTLIPALQLLRMSVSEVEVVSGGTHWTFVGLKHLRALLTDPIAFTALKNTLIFVLVVVPIETGLGLGLAYVSNQTRVLTGFYRTILILPLLLPPIAIGALWRLILDSNYGALSQILLRFGVSGPLWIADPKLAMPTIMFVDVWHWTSFMFLIFLAGVQSIPTELEEAAEMDGANPVQVFTQIVLPLLRSTILVALMLRTIMAFKVFDVPYLLTGGGPGSATEVINIYIEKVFFQQFRVGYGAMLALGAAVVLSIFIVFYRRLSARQAAQE